jgi:CRP/FNR family cyclic AMP-dependent transcriptional regulator
MDAPLVEGTVHVLEVDPDLAAALPEADLIEANRDAVASVLRLKCGAWSPPDEAEPAHMGLLVLEGLLTHQLVTAGGRSVELLMAGDVLRPWVTLGIDGPAGVHDDWAVMEPATVAILDPAFARRVGRWPEMAGALMDRLATRARWLTLDLAVAHVRRLDDRLMLLFWQLARRWGKVTPDGVVIPLNLQHQLLATLIGAKRPSVTTRLGALRDQGLLARRADGSWLLPGGAGGNVLEGMDLDRPMVPV